jgi:hypothetical protein
MQARLFLGNKTDDFNASIPSPLNDPTSDDYFLCWFDTKEGDTPGSPPESVSSRAASRLELARRFSLRQEDFGALVLDTATNKVYQLDHQAAEAMSLLLAGIAPQTVAERLQVAPSAVDDLVAWCLAGQQFNDGVFQ